MKCRFSLLFATWMPAIDLGERGHSRVTSRHLVGETACSGMQPIETLIGYEFK
jgi:hypothetical protein